MKTALLSSLTFVLGLGLGMGLPWLRLVAGNPAEDKLLIATPANAAAKLDGTMSRLSGVAGHGRYGVAVPADTGTTSAAVEENPFTAWAAALEAGELGTVTKRSKLLKRMAKADPALAWQTLLSSGLPIGRGDVLDIADIWYEQDAVAAAAFGLTLQEPLQRSAFLRRVLSKWMLEQPGAFAAWFHAQSPDLDLARYLNSGNLVYKAGTCTLAELDSLLRVDASFPGFPDFVGRQAAKLWAQPGQRQATTDWLHRITDSALRDALWKQIVAGTSQEDPRAAAQAVAEISQPVLRREAGSTVAAHLARTDPAAALAFAATLADEADARSAWASAVSTWGLRQPGQALAYVQENLASLSSSALNPVLRNLGESRPTEVLAIAATLPDSRDRRLVVMDVFMSWRSREPEAAQLWMESDRSTFLSAVERTNWINFRSPSSPAPVGSSSHSTAISGRPVYYVY